MFSLKAQTRNGIHGKWVSYKTSNPSGSARFKIPDDSLHLFENGLFERKIYEHRTTPRVAIEKPYMHLSGTYKLKEDSIEFRDISFRFNNKLDTMTSYSNKIELKDNGIFLLYENLGTKRKIKYGKSRRYFRKVQ